MADRPNLAADGWELADAVKLSAESRSFQIPSEEERRALRTGQRVKLVFLIAQPSDPDDIQGERMWVTVTEVLPGHYRGCLESSPVTSDVLRPGDVVDFTADHVAAVMIPVTDPRHPHYRAT
jgi:hypothetical protein